MADDRLEDERPLKRQKLEDGIVRGTNTTAHNGYICLQKQPLRASCGDTDLYKALIKQEAALEVELIECHYGAHVAHVQVKIPELKRNASLEIQHYVQGHVEFLSTVINLPSSVKASKKAFDPPISKYLAELTLHDSVLSLEVRHLWHDNATPREKIDNSLAHILRQKISQSSASASLESEAWSVKEFYDNVHVPEPTFDQQPLFLEEVQCTLYPFQERATRWMLSKEGVEISGSRQLKTRPPDDLALPLDFQESMDEYGNPCFISSALSVACSSRTEVDARYGRVSGGILAEAMGLGKTVEMIALMCSHSKEKSPLQQTTQEGLVPTRATLIITPPTILEQWKEELREHAPSLQVLHYTGIKANSKRKDDLVKVLSDHDVVLTTYNVVASEIHYAQERPDRNMRNRPRRDPPKSPLTQILWWRCLLDEAQMIESGVSNAAVVARLIPRVHAWAVTGTPLKQSHRDLYGLLLFLRYQPWCQSPRIWDRLVLYNRPLLRKLINSIALRHSKELVREELRIPAQARRVVNIPFTAVEESHYAQMHYDMQQDVGVDSAGAPLDGEWDPDHPVTVEKMRNWLQRLRQTCLHPEVGGRNRRALGKRGGGPLRTVAQVLDVMIEQTDSTVHTEQRNLLMARTDQARLFEHARQSEEAQAMFRAAYAEATAFVNDCRTELTKELGRSKEKAENQNAEDVDTDAEDEEAESSLTTARQRLRSALEVQHICIFFIGNTWYQLKEKEELKLSPPQTTDEVNALGANTETPASENLNQSLSPDVEAIVKTKIGELEKLETEAYEEAKKIRKELLTETRAKAQRRITRIRTKRQGDDFAVIPKLNYSPDDYGGIESRKVFERLFHYCKAMNTQADQYREVREKMVDMLCSLLVDEEEEVELTGGEYEDSTKHQDEMYVVMEMLRALFADRSDALSGQENLLLKGETRQWLRSAKEGEGPAPEMMIKLLAERQAIKIDPTQQGSLRGLVAEVRSLQSSLEWQSSTNSRARAELSIVNDLLKHVQHLQAEQTRAQNVLEQEVNSIRDTMNARLGYYRALQVISDMVTPIGEDEAVGMPINENWLNRLRDTEASTEKKLSVASSKRRYLLHLKNEQESEGEAKICTICQFEFEIGTLTVCGHQFCKECIQMWWSEHRNCPVCKRRLHLADFYDVTYKPAEPTIEVSATRQEEPLASITNPQANSIYTSISEHTLQQIKSIDLRNSSYGSKVDTLVRHILYLRKADPGSKSVIFSQYRDFLDVLSRSLRDNNIIHSKFDDKDGIVDFKFNPANECFLLHAKAHSAGLNLVCASHVVLCEPLINTAIELQAVARVHRIGQIRETCVWMYLIEGTVEEAIYDISVKRRLAHMDSKSRGVSRTTSRAVTPTPGSVRDLSEIVIEAADAKELQAADLSKMFASGKTGGEMVDKEDLWSCLFGNADKRAGTLRKGGPSRGLTDLGVTSNVPRIGAGSEIGRFLRAEAVDRRRENNVEELPFRQ